MLLNAAESMLGFPGGSGEKSPPVLQEMQVWSLVQEDSLEEEMTTQSNIIARTIPWKEVPSRLQSTGSQESDMT